MDPDFPLHSALSSQNEELSLAILREGNCSLNQTDKEGQRPLQLAVKASLGKPLISMLGDPNCVSQDFKDVSGLSPLDLAVRSGVPHIVQILLLDPNTTNLVTIPFDERPAAVQKLLDGIDLDWEEVTSASEASEGAPDPRVLQAGSLGTTSIP